MQITSNDADENPFTVGLFGVTPLQMAQQAYLKSSNTGSLDGFGYSVAVSGDTVVVGAYREDSSSAGVNNDRQTRGQKFRRFTY